MTDHLSLNNHSVAPSLKHQTFIDLNDFSEEKYLILMGEKALDNNTKNSIPYQVEYQESAVDNCMYNVNGVSHDSVGKTKIDSEVQTAAISLLLLRTRNKGFKMRHMSSRLINRPEWLPLDWDFTYKVRPAGSTAGRTDKYFISPSGQRFRSKVEVLHYLETGSKRKIGSKSKTDSEATPSKSPLDRKKKKSKSNPRENKSKSNPRDFSDLKFDFENPPQSVTWARAGAGDSPDDWVPSIGSTPLPESIKTEWGTTYARVTRLDKSKGAS